MATDYNDGGDKKPTGKCEAPPLSQSLQGHLGRQLRAAYSELVHEPMPDRFGKLLEDLAKSQVKAKPKSEDQE